MRMAAIALSVALTAGCGQSTTNTGDEVVVEFEALKDAMCACKDVACANAASVKFNEWLARNEFAQGDVYAQRAAERIAKEYARCLEVQKRRLKTTETAPSAEPEHEAKPKPEPKPAPKSPVPSGPPRPDPAALD